MKTCKMGLQKGEKGTIITFVKKYLPKNRLELEPGVRRLGGEGTLENLIELSAEGARLQGRG